MKIGISGYFGYMNFGDELFLKTWKQLFYEHQVHAIQSYEDINNLDVIIVGGGDLLIPSTFTSAYWRQEFLNKPTYVYGIGVPSQLPLNDKSKAEYKEFFSKCNLVATRDKVSGEYLQENEIYENPEVVEDVAFGYKNPGIKISKFNKITVGLSIRPNPHFRFADMVNLACHICSRGFELLLIPLQPAADPMWRDDNMHHMLKQRVEYRVKGAVVNVTPENIDVDHRWAMIGACNYFVSMRMHGVVASLLQGVPCIVLGDSNKFPRIMEKFGMGDFCKSYLDKDFIQTFEKLIDNQTKLPDLKDHAAYLKTKALGELIKFKQQVLSECSHKQEEEK